MGTNFLSNGIEECPRCVSWNAGLFFVAKVSGSGLLAWCNSFSVHLKCQDWFAVLRRSLKHFLVEFFLS